MKTPLLLAVIQGEFSVCQLAGPRQPTALAALAAAADFYFLAGTDEEQSLVCRAGCEPAACAAVDAGWRAFRVAGQLDFGLVGILAGIASVLAGAGISIFAVSTFKTDYVLVKAASFEAALDTLQAAGYEIGVGV